jgi:predicted MPP superfamily phosphohydrolase
MSLGLAIRFLLFFSTVSGLLCFTVYKILKNRLQLTPLGNHWLLGFFVVVFFILILGPLHFRWSKIDPANSFEFALQFTQYYCMGLVGVLFIGLVFVEILQLLFQTFDPTKRVFLTVGVSRAITAGLGLSTGIGMAQALRGPSVVPVKLTIPTLPVSFKNAKITQISDVHIGPLLHRDFLVKIVEQVNATQPDFIFITGDLVDGTVDQLRHHIEPLRDLRARDGVYFCTGNHEYYSDVETWIPHLESLGIHVFKNSNVIIKRKSEQNLDEHLMIAGVFDIQANRFSKDYSSDCDHAAKSDIPVAAKLLLAHNPQSITAAAAAGFHVQFSGHTHAGQFYPFSWITQLILKHSEGLYKINDVTQLYVNRGTGYWGPPNRLGKPGEITVFTLDQV